MTTETDNVHGHDLLSLIAAAEPGLTLEALVAEVNRRWGISTTFRTCSQRDLTLNQLVQFLLERGKLFMKDGKVCVNHANVCRQGDSHSQN